MNRRTPENALFVILSLSGLALADEDPSNIPDVYRNASMEEFGGYTARTRQLESE